MNIYKELKSAGVPLDNYCSDLYARVTPESTEIIKKYKYRKSVEIFIDNINGQRWYDIPFAYPKWYDNRQEVAK